MNQARLSLTALIIFSCLALSLFACGTSEQAAQPTPDQTDNAGKPAVPTLTQVTTKTGKTQTSVILKGSESLTYTAFYQAQPPVIYIDLGADANDEALKTKAIQNSTIKAVEALTVPGVANLIRVKIALTKPSTYRVVREGNDLNVMIKNVSGVALSPPEDLPKEAAYQSQGAVGEVPMVSDYKLEPLGNTGRSRLNVELSRNATPKIFSRDYGRTVVLSLKPAYIEPGKVKTAFPAGFKSAVNSIRPSSLDNEIEFVIKLQSMVPYHLGQRGKSIFLDFDAPPVATASPVSGFQGPTPFPTPVAAPARPSGQASRPVTVASQNPTGYSAPAADKSAPTATAGQTAGIPTPKKKEKQIRGWGEDEENQKKSYHGKKISLDFQNAEIHNILRLIGEVGGKNVVVSDAVKGKVTLRLQNVPWDQALDIVLNSKQLGKVEHGNVMRIDTTTNLIAEKRTSAQEQAAEEARKRSMPPVKRVFTPKYRSAVDIANEITKFFSNKKITASGSGNTQQTQTDVVGDEKDGRVAVIGNDIYVETDPESMNAIVRIFNKLDQQTQQVLIEARIVEASSDFTRQVGINWGGEVAAGYDGAGPDPSSNWGAGGLFGSNNAVNLISSTTYGARIGFSLLEDTFSLSAQLHAMEQAGDGRVISAPRIMASNDETVMISQGTSIPYETTATDSTASTITFEQADLLLEVTPHIEQNGKIITLDLHVTKDTPDPSYATNPPIDTREAKTKLMVKNGETVVIGGIVTDSKSRRANRVPLLHRIPLIGWMFQSYEVTDDKVELLIFLTTNIIPVVI